MITVHANSSVRPTASGPEIFIHQPGATALALSSADRAADQLPVPGGPSRPITFLPWAAVQGEHLTASRALGEQLALSLGARLGGAPRHVRSVPLRMLAGVNAPAVHLEVGYLTNPEEAARLVTDAFQNQIVDAVVEALTRFRGDAEAAQ